MQVVTIMKWYIFLLQVFFVGGKMKTIIKIISTIFLFSAISTSAFAIDKLHFVVPGGAGGGWDGCARGTGEALVKSGLLGSASFENMSGGGGGKALAWMIKTQPKNNIHNINII